MNKRLISLALALVLALSGGSQVHAASIPTAAPQVRTATVSSGGFIGDLQGDWSPEARAAWDMAIGALNAHLQIAVPVEVKVSLEPLPPSTLGRGGSSGSKVNFPGAPIPDLWYPNSLANQFANERLSPGPDVEQHPRLGLQRRSAEGPQSRQA